jgi:hypothetical protein
MVYNFVNFSLDVYEQEKSLFDWFGISCMTTDKFDFIFKTD